jgi:hypothetical protein
VVERCRRVVTIVNQDRHDPGEHIVRVLAGTPLPAFSQVKHGLLVR